MIPVGADCRPPKIEWLKGMNAVMKNLLILFGGQSSEHRVSCSSAASLIPHIDSTRFQAFVVGITQRGEWFLTNAESEDIASGRWEMCAGNRPAFISPNRSLPGLQVLDGAEKITVPIDCVYPVMHGELCEDGAIQGLLELSGIPYVGPDICASACSMDKAVTKLIVAATGIRQAKYYVALAAEYGRNADAVAHSVEQCLGGYPVFVKPASAGSSVGVAKAYGRGELMAALEKAFKICGKVLVEETVTGRELEVAVLGNEEPEASVVGEVLAANDFYDFNAKYENSNSRTVIPAAISEEDSDRIRRAAICVYRALGCAVMSRVDFFLRADGEIVLNEINTLPGFTEISMYPKLWEASGIPFSQLLTRLCELAMERGCKAP